MSNDLDIYLAATEFLDCGEPSIQHLAESLKQSTPQATAVTLFDWVRDNVRYDPYVAIADRPSYRASAVLESRRGHCVQKALLLAALARALGIPTRLGFADVRNHKASPKMLALMGTNLFVFHGYVEFFLDGRWVKATPAFDPEVSRRAGVLPVELDGSNDAMFHPVDPQGHPFIEYVRDRGTYADLPFEEMLATLAEVYSDRIEAWQAEHLTRQGH